MENTYNSNSVVPNKPVDTYDPYGENTSQNSSPVNSENGAENASNNSAGDFQNSSDNSSNNISSSGKKSPRNKKKKSKKGIVITIIIVVVLLLIILIARGCSKMMTKVTESLGEDVIVEEYGMKDMTTYINTSGKVGSQTVCKVTTSLQYPIKEIKVEIGDRVKKGDVLCTIDTTELDEKIEALEAQASDEDRRAATEIEVANRQVAQARESTDTNVANAAQAVTDAENAVAQAEGERIEAEQALNQAEQALNQKKKQAEKEAEKARKQAEKEAEKAKKEAKKNKKKGNNTDTDAATETTTQATTQATTQNSTELSEKDPDVVAYNTAKQVYSAAVQKKEEKVAAHKAAVDAYNQALQGQKDTIQNAENSNELTLSGISSYSQTASQLAECYKMKNDSVILAETDGIVTAMNGIEGLVANGPIMQIEDDKNLQIAVDIKERDILTINESMKAEISNNALEEVTGKGQVSKVINFVSGSGSEAQISQTGESADKYSAIIKVTEANNMLLGMNVKVKISTGTQVQVMAVPYTAIMTDDDGDYVCVAVPAGTSGMFMVQRVSVETGVTGDYYTEIVGGDLKEGAKVISYPDTVTIGGVIKVTN